MNNLITTCSLASLSQLDTFALRLAACLQAGDTLLLDGDLGAGKTSFTKALCQALGSQDAVTSPTYTIAQLYSSPLGPLLHIDAYRLESPAEIWDLGYEEQMEYGLTFIEWGQRVAEEFPEALRLQFLIESETQRQVEISALDAGWHQRLAGLEAV